MNKNIVFFSWLCLLSLTSLGDVGQGNSLVLKKFAGERGGVEVELIRARYEDFTGLEGAIYWGSEREPITLVKSFSVNYSSRKLLIPLSAYSDLSNVLSLEVAVTDTGFSVIIDGGQVSSHYQASFSFDSEGYLVSRYVKSFAFPDELWEKTEYSFIRRDDM